MGKPDDDLLRDLLPTFRAEAADHLQAMNQALLRLERQPPDAERQELLRTAFRAAHSLKGAARAVSLNEIEALAHAMESVLQSARDANAVLKPDTCDVLYDALDAMQHLLEGKESDLNALHARLAAAGGEQPAPQAEPAPKKAARPAAKPASPKAEAPQSPGGPQPSGGPQPESGPQAEAGAQADSGPAFAPGAETIRVAVDKLDTLMAQAGELVISRISAGQRVADTQALRNRVAQAMRTWRELRVLQSQIKGDVARHLNDLLNQHYEQLQTLSRELDSLDRAFNTDTTRLGMVASQLQDEVRRVRMVPFQTIVLGLERAVRDAAHAEGKEVDLIVRGADVELDKKVLEMLKDPLLHLLRNAVGHGIETPDARRNAKKSPTGQVRLEIQQRGSEVRIVVGDDGRGFDLQALREASARHGGPVLDENASRDEIIALAFLPGMTTAQKITSMSGRGVGLDVVRQRLESLQGRIEISSTFREGTTFTLAVPASLTMTRGLLVSVGGATYGLPLLSVEQIVPPKDIFHVEGQPMLMINEAPLPLVPLPALLELEGAAGSASLHPLAVVLGVAEQRIAVLVDDVINEQELAVKPLGKPLRRVRNVSGAALLGDGRPVIVLNPADLVKTARGRRRSYTLTIGQPVEEDRPPAHILVVDDSITTRTLEKNILETAGYRVSIATDGIEALRCLEADMADIVVSDVQMPNMDGIEFTRTLRESNRYGNMPIILVTSLESREDREQGMLAGANAYIVKRGFDQAELIATIEQYLS